MSLLSSDNREDIRRRIKSLSDSLTYHAVNALGVFARSMSRRQAEGFANLLGDFMHAGIGLRREVVYRNLGLTFPEKPPGEIRAIAAKVYRNVAFTLLDVLRFPLIRTREDAAALVDIDNLEAVYRSTENGRKGAVLVSAHYGNWELLALTAGILVAPMTVIVKELSNRLVDRRMNEFRTLRGNSVVYDDKALREGLRVLADGGMLAILADQSDPSSTYFGEFLGRRATMFHGAAFFALKAQVPLFVAMCRHGSNGKYRIEVTEIDMSDLTCCKEDIATLASRYTLVLEEYIRRWPEEWFWLHNRWKNGGDGQQ
jgi:KDO2-lipid IV(A) lauroyltransferase